jgi:predicted TIM-barrel fold metal-dependent hydrolase
MIDALVILGENLFAETLTVNQCLANAERLGVTGVIAAPARGRDYHLGAANDRLAVDSAPHPAIRRLARVDPNQGSDAVDELRRCIRDLGCVGLFLNPEEEVFRIQDAEPLVREAAERGLPTVIAAGVPLRSEPLQILDLADRVPEARLILTSGGQINISGLGMIDAWLALLRNANLFVLSNGEYRQDFLERIARDLGPERLLFASFAPYYEQAFEVARIRNVEYDPAARALIERANALQMFG